MECHVCFREVSGDITVSSLMLPGEMEIIRLAGTPDRDWISCDSCGTVVCLSCCRHPETGFCDGCSEKYNLLAADEEPSTAGDNQSDD
ncbi:MAG TPA: hypothetical protein VFD58_08230 [Blastocatellia bacterium]|nr:hypothetical protein [Blastocatellia bacterium]